LFTTEDKLEEVLFEFSNRIGAFITYTLIQDYIYFNSSHEP